MQAASKTLNVLTSCLQAEKEQLHKGVNEFKHQLAMSEAAQQRTADLLEV